MALTLPRWIAAMVAGMLMIAAAAFSVKPKPPRPMNRRDFLTYETHLAGANVSRAATRLRALVLRDSIRVANARGASSNESRFLIGGDVPADLRGFDRVLGIRLDLIRTQQRAEPIDIAFAYDTVSTLRSGTMYQSFAGLTHILPSARGERCTTIVRHAPRNPFYVNYRRYWNSWLTGVRLAAQVLGPCGFYEAFGQPGSGLDAWLVGGAWRFGTSSALRNPPIQFGWVDSRSSPLWGSSAGWPLRRFVSSIGYRCASGDAAACHSVLFDRNADERSRFSSLTMQDRVIAYTNGTQDFDAWNTTLGPREDMFLADMAIALGADRFGRFWKSDKAPAEAFRDATGQDIGEWSVAWARQHYGVNERGPGPAAGTVVWSLLLAVAGLSAAVATNRRRQMA